MKVKDILKIVKSSSIKNLNVSKEAYITYIYLAVVELMKRLNLNIKSEVIKAHPALSVYELDNCDVDQLLIVYDESGHKLYESDIVDSKVSKFKMLSYKSFIYDCCKEQDLICVYKATIPSFENEEEEVHIPNAALHAIICYVAYIGISTLGGSDELSQRDVNNWYGRFEKSCMDLEYLGYKVNIFNESIDSKLKGFI